jgi:hypothetical protein
MTLDDLNDSNGIEYFKPDEPSAPTMEFMRRILISAFAGVMIAPKAVKIEGEAVTVEPKMIGPAKAECVSKKRGRG